MQAVVERGGMGAIWLGADLTTGARVAIKVLRLDAYAREDFAPAEWNRRLQELVRRFEREGRILADLDHPSIPRLLHHGRRGGEPCLVMEYVDGVSLRELLLRHRPLPVAAAASIAHPVAEGLSHAHARGVVHRDLKPGNILVSRVDGAVKLVDFGIAHLTDPEATRYTVLGATPGSVGYMAPEQIRGARDITPSADLYAFGCVLFELLTGARPFEDLPDRSRDIRHLEDAPPPPCLLNPCVPPALDALVSALLEKGPANRPESADVIADVLSRHLPRPGDPAPEPLMDPDPTARFRLPEGVARPSTASPQPGAITPPRAGSRGRGRDGWLNREDVRRQLDEAGRELDAQRPADACRRLPALLVRAEAEWGVGDPLVVQTRWLCTELDRLRGGTG
nr:serine/threonine-protein kinase [Streptomyces sp. MST-110588]